MSIREDNEDCIKLPQPSQNQDNDSLDGIWNTIITRFPTTALILREMGEVIDDAQILLKNFKSITHLQNVDSHDQSESSIINDSDNTSIKLNELTDASEIKINNKAIQSDEFECMIVNHSFRNESIEEWNKFGNNNRVMEPSCSLSAQSFNSSSSSSSASVFLNATSTTTLEQVKGEKSPINDALYEIEKINALDYSSAMKNYESTISITKQAEIIKNVEFTMPTLTMKDVILVPIKPRVCTHTGDTAMNNLYELVDETERQSVIKSPPRNSSSPVPEKPSAIPRPISIKSRAMKHNK